jgi:hypothetical protein
MVIYNYFQRTRKGEINRITNSYTCRVREGIGAGRLRKGR